MKKMVRRQFLSGMVNGVAVSLGLPIFNGLVNNSGTAFADGTPFPKRFGVFFWGLGYGWDASHYVPKGRPGAGDSWNIPQGHGLYGLNAHKDYLTVFGNYSYANPPGVAHKPHTHIALSASHFPVYFRYKEGERVAYWGDGAPLGSIDAVVEKLMGASGQLGKYPYINMSLGLGGEKMHKISWNPAGNMYSLGSSTPRNFYNSPENFFNNILKFNKGTPTGNTNGGAIVDNVTRFGLSVLDGVLPDLKSYRSGLDASDKAILDVHVSEVELMEKNLRQLIKDDGGGLGGGPVCPANSPAFGAFPIAEKVAERHKLMSQMMTYALRCDLTRIFSYEFLPYQADGVVVNDSSLKDYALNLTRTDVTKLADGVVGLHGYSHGSYGDATAPLQRYFSFCMANFGVMAQQFKDVTIGSTSMLDHMLVLGTSEFGHANGHTLNGVPYIFLGKAGGGLKGNYYSDTGKDQSIDALGGWNVYKPRMNNEGSRVLLTAVRAMGLKLDKIGLPSVANQGNASGENPRTHNYETNREISEVLTGK